MSSSYPIIDNRPIDQLKVTELKDELKKRKLPTKGLKEELIRRLDEAMREEQDTAPSEAEDGCDSTPSEEEMDELVNAKNHKDDSDAGHLSDSIVDEKISVVEDDSRVPLDEGKFSVDKPVDGVVSTIIEQDQMDQINVKTSPLAKEDQIAEVSVVQTNVLVSVNVESATALSGEDSKNGKTQSESEDVKNQLEENHISIPSHVEAKVSSSNLENQVSEVSPVLGIQVTCDSVSTDVSIDEKTELKDNVIADDAILELDVKPEMVQLSSSSVVPDNGKSHPMDVEEPHDEKVSVEEPDNENDRNVDIVKTDGNGDSAEKLQLDRSPGDDSMEEDVSEGKIADSKLDFERVKDESKETKVNMTKDVESVPSGVVASSAVTKDANVEDNGTSVQTIKRKSSDQGMAVGSNDIVKRQRRWNSEDLKVPEKKADAPPSITPKDFFQPSFRRSFSRSDSMAKDEAPKERVVPPSLEAPTNSLKIENFLRPFTLKTVQDLLGKTGTVTNFWMDAIKTHCFVSFSSVEEAIETRNAVYNLQWPPNGGKLLVAEFVDSQEVKDKVEAPPQSPLTPATPASRVPASAAPPQPTPRQQQIQNRPLQPPQSLPPPPALSNPPPLRKLPTETEQHRPLQPPPAPLPAKADPPIVTLDDLFRKTKATPRIYYLPLSDEQVAAKLKAQGKSIIKQ